MKGGEPSATALAAAAFRAAHLHLFEGPHIHEDVFALALLGAADASALRERFEWAPPPDLGRISAYFALRHRYNEDRLVRAIARGVSQVVLLGAGLDSQALRNPAIPRSVHYVEIDHPDSQSWKLARLRALGLSTPDVHYVPVDFTTRDLGSALAEARIDPARPTFFAWLGVSQYLPEAVTRGTFARIHEHAAGSEVVFDVILPFAGLSAAELAISSFAEAGSRARGEPWLAYYAPDSLASTLRALGYREVETLSPARAAPYYAGQPAAITPLEAWQLMAAVV